MKTDAQTLSVPDEQRLQQVLDAAVAYVEGARPVFRYDATDPGQFELPDPPADLRLGTLRMAARWHQRRRASDGMANMQEQGVTQVPYLDPDISRLLGIGRHRPLSESFA